MFQLPAIISTIYTIRMRELMDSMLDDTETLDWPPLGAAQECASETYSFRVRRFGLRRADLDIDFAAIQPRVAAGVLSVCLCMDGGSIDTTTVLQWTLKKRLQGLLAVYCATFGDELTIDARCTHRDCGEWLQLPLSMLSFVDAGGDGIMTYSPIEAIQLRLRLPTGEDQLLWSKQRQMQTLFGSMAATLVTEVNNQTPEQNFYVPEQWLAGLETLLEQHDPLTALHIKTVCVECEREFSIALDLERQMLAQFAQLQRSLLDQVHILAGAYHWSERDIMDLTPERRQWYLRKLDKAWPA